MPIPLFWSRLIPFWRSAEILAAGYLRRVGFRVVASSFRVREGEVDLIALDRSVIVFIEVKTRKGDDAGSPFEAVDRRKQRQLVRIANYYLSRHRLHGRDARFDVVGVRFAEGDLRCELLRNAFDVA